MKKNDFHLYAFLLLTATLLSACGGSSSDAPNDPDEPPVLQDGTSKGILFIAQTPNPGGSNDLGTHTTTFGNGLPTVQSAPRGGSLFFLQADGTLRDLLDEALKNGCEAGGDAICNEAGAFAVDASGLLVNGYVVRRPIVHWDADRVLFSMTYGTILEQHDGPTPPDIKWQLYEITGLDPDDAPLLTKVEGQPDFNNVDGVYGSNDEIFFISDKTVTGNPDHYPQRDEYESLPINTGLWKLHRETGAVTLMDHSPSGDFGPKITPSGQLIFTRWDHLQADQQGSNSMIKALDPQFEDTFGIYTYASEDDTGPNDYVLMEEATRAHLEAYATTGDIRHLEAAGEVNGTFPEPNGGNPFYNWGNKHDDDGNVRTIAGTFVDGNEVAHEIPFITPRTEHGEFNYLIFNHFLPWQIRQDGEQCETYRHTGLHENGRFILRSYYNDPALRDVEETEVSIREANGFFLNDVHDDPETGYEIVTGVLSPEFGTHKSGRILQFIDEDIVAKPQLHENGSAVSYRFLTAEDDARIYRDPVFLTDGRLIAAVSSDPRKTGKSGFDAFDFTLHVLEMNEATGFYEPKGAFLSEGIERDLDFWLEEGGRGLQQFSGRFWEIEAQEVIARTAPVVPDAPLVEDPELEMFEAADVTPEQFKQYLKNNNLAAIVVRNATVRDDADTTQPFNLVVEKDGTRHEMSVRAGDYVEGETKLYPISYLQLMRSDYLRGYIKFANFDENDDFVSDGGRRVQPNPLQMTDALAHNLPVDGSAPDGAVPIFEDGSIAALVPARRAMTWQTTDDDGDPIVRERYWLTFQPGEVRVCASCHGVNEGSQDGNGKPQNSPEALRSLLIELKNAGVFDGL